MSGLELARFSALTLDCYGTLIDWESGILDALGPWLRRQGAMPEPEAVLAAFARHEPLIQEENPALPYTEVLARVHRALAADLGLSADEEAGREFAASIGRWPPFPDTVEALRALRARFRLVVVSNVDRASFARTEEALGHPFFAVVTAEDVGSYKPAPGHFLRALEILAGAGIAREQVLHVAQSFYHDIAPAKALGLAAVWLDRRRGRTGGAARPAAAAPDLRIESLAELVARCRAARR